MNGRIYDSLGAAKVILSNKLQRARAGPMVVSYLLACLRYCCIFACVAVGYYFNENLFHMANPIYRYFMTVLHTDNVNIYDEGLGLR